MTYFVLERVPGSTKAARDAAVADMAEAGYTSVSADTIRLDQQETGGTGWQAQSVSGLGLAPRVVTAIDNQYGATPRFRRKTPRDIDLVLNLFADDMAERDAALAKFETVTSEEFLLKKYESGSTFTYWRVWLAGGGNFALVDGDTTDTNVDMLITVRAHKPDALNGG